MWGAVVCLIIALLVVRISRWLHDWANPKCDGNGILPPGSMGLPIIGETIEFFSPHSLDDIPPFIKKRMQRYGAVFRTSLVGQKSFVEILGQQSLLAHHGMVHKYLKNLILQLVSPENQTTS
ncbi:hypothetical protein REPUB_Repub12eG0187200 [Reevesia pubescens]